LFRSEQELLQFTRCVVRGGRRGRSATASCRRSVCGLRRGGWSVRGHGRLTLLAAGREPVAPTCSPLDGRVPTVSLNKSLASGSLHLPPRVRRVARAVCDRANAAGGKWFRRFRLFFRG